MRWCFSIKQQKKTEQNRAIKGKIDGGQRKIMLTQTDTNFSDTRQMNEPSWVRDKVSFSPLSFFLPFTISLICCLGSIPDTQAILIMVERDVAVKH